MFPLFANWSWWHTSCLTLLNGVWSFFLCLTHLLLFFSFSLTLFTSFPVSFLSLLFIFSSIWQAFFERDKGKMNGNRVVITWLVLSMIGLSMSGPENCLKRTYPCGDTLTQSTDYQALDISLVVLLTRNNVLLFQSQCSTAPSFLEGAGQTFSVEIALPIHRDPLEQNFLKFLSWTFASIPKVERMIQWTPMY